MEQGQPDPSLGFPNDPAAPTKGTCGWRYRLLLPQDSFTKDGWRVDVTTAIQRPTCTSRPLLSIPPVSCFHVPILHLFGCSVQRKTSTSAVPPPYVPFYPLSAIPTIKISISSQQSSLPTSLSFHFLLSHPPRSPAQHSNIHFRFCSNVRSAKAAYMLIHRGKQQHHLSSCASIMVDFFLETLP